MSQQRFKILASSLVLAFAYCVTGRLGLMLPAVGSQITLVWLPTGIAVAALLRCSFRCWPGVSLGALAVNLAVGETWSMATGIAVGNTLGPLLAALMLRRTGFHPSFDRKRDILLLAAAAALGMLVSATLGVGVLSQTTLLPTGWLTAWLTWWAGDVMGVIVAAPLAFRLTRDDGLAILQRWGEFCIWLCTTVAVTWAVFVLNRGSAGGPWALAFVPLPLVAWATLSFGAIGTSLAVIVLSVGAAYGTATGHGPFYRVNPIEGTVVLWVYMATSALLGWIITALRAAGIQATGIQHLLERALSDVSLGVLLAGRDRRITYANEGFTRLTGYTEAELLGKSCAILQGPATDPEITKRLHTAIHGDGFFDGKILNYRKDGTTFWNALLVSPTRDERGAMTGFIGIQRDITQRRQTELALRRSEEQFRMLANNLPDVVARFDRNHRYLYVNPMVKIATGIAPEAFAGRTSDDLGMPPANNAVWKAALARVFSTGGEERLEFSHPSPAGSAFWEARMVAERGVNGDTESVLVVSRDVTEQRRSEVRSAGERAVLELLASGAPLATVLDRLARSYEENFSGMLCSVMLVDAGGKHLRHCASPSLPEAFCQAMDGVTIDARSGSRGSAIFNRQTTVAADLTIDPLWADYCDIALASGLRACWSVPLISSQNRVIGSLALYARKPASPRPDEVLTLERGAHFASLAIERHELLASLQESQVRLGTLVGNLPGMAYRCQNDQSRTMTYVSDGCEAITGYRREELENNATIAYGNIVHPEDHDWLLAKCQASLDIQAPCQNEYRILDKQGRERWVSERASGVYAADGALLSIDGFIQDITAAREAKLERSQLERKMQETQKLESLGVLAGGIAHDFNNLLTSILGNASIATLELPTGSSAQDCLTQITEASQRAADLCKQMLAYSGRGHFVLEKLNLSQIVEQTTQMLHLSISKKALIRYYLGKALPPIEADATQIRQVIMNLVMNASEAIGDESGVIGLCTGVMRVDGHYLQSTLMAPDIPEGDYVFLEIADSGCGMNAETQSKIFDPFFTTKFTGRGLGLAAVLGIVRGHGGALSVHSEVGRGTTFKLLFPVAIGSSDMIANLPTAIPEWYGEGTVLVVDDEEAMRNTVARMMRHMGLDPVLACDGHEAVEIFSADPTRFTLVLLDLTMPRMDGVQTIIELRRLRPDVRVVLMSGYNAQDALSRFTGKGLASFLQKPFTISDLRAVLQDVLG